MEQVKQLMGYSSIRVTGDSHGHLFEDHAALLMPLRTPEERAAVNSRVPAAADRKRWASDGQLPAGKRGALPGMGHQHSLAGPNGIRTRAATLRGRPGRYVE